MDKAAAKFMRPVITCIHHLKVKGKQSNDIHADVRSDACIKSREHARADRSSQVRTISVSTTEGHDPSRKDDNQRRSVPRAHLPAEWKDMIALCIAVSFRTHCVLYSTKTL